MKTSLKITLALLLLLIMIALFAYKYIAPSSEKSLTIAAGREGGMYYQYANKYATTLENQGFKITILKTAGSVENIALLESGKADIAFVQGGVADAKAKAHLHSIASIYFEPLWLFYRDMLSDVHYLSDLNPQRLSIGEDGSGTKDLVSKLFAINALEINGTLSLSTNDAYEAFKAEKIDAFFAVGAAKSSQIMTLLSDETLKVASLKRIPAYTKQFPYLSAYPIPEGALSLKSNIPKHDLNLLATTATLVAKEGLPDDLVRFITIQVKKTSTEKVFPTPKYVDIPIHPEAKKYLTKGESLLEKIFPYWIASNIDKLKYLLIPILTLMIPLIKGIFPLYKWRVRSKIYRWYDILERLEKRSDDQTLKRLQTLMREVDTHTDVPLSYMGELYDLKMHIELVIQRERLKRR